MAKPMVMPVLLGSITPPGNCHRSFVKSDLVKYLNLTDLLVGQRFRQQRKVSYFLYYLAVMYLFNNFGF